MTTILFLLILTALIFVHELGHFSVAKLFKIKVEEFAIGFPPKIISFVKGETKYSLNIIPFGGFVKILGENPNEESTEDGRNFQNAKKWKQILILLAGIFMNFVFAWLLFSISLSMGIFQPISNDEAKIATNKSFLIVDVLKDSPAEIAGLKENDKIISIMSGSKSKITNNLDIEDFLKSNSTSFKIEYQRGDKVETLEVSPAEGIIEGRKVIGISTALFGEIKLPFYKSLELGLLMTYGITKSTILGFVELIKGIITRENGIFSHFSGPVGIAKMVGEAQKVGTSYLLQFIGYISINLAVLNLIPFPALDGGRALFVVMEAVTRKKIKPKVFNIVNGIGFALLIALMIFVTFKDVLKLIN